MPNLMAASPLSLHKLSPRLLLIHWINTVFLFQPQQPFSYFLLYLEKSVSLYLPYNPAARISPCLPVHTRPKDSKLVPLHWHSSHHFFAVLLPSGSEPSAFCRSLVPSSSTQIVSALLLVHHTSKLFPYSSLQIPFTIGVGLGRTHPVWS